MTARIARGGEHAGRVIARHPDRWFSAGTEIVTGPTEAAVLLRNGKAVAVIPPGKTRVLDIAQAPFLASLAQAGGASFAADIFFVTTGPLHGVAFQARKSILDAKAHHAVAVAFAGEATVRVTEAGVFARQVAASEALEADPLRAIAKTLGDVVADAVERTLAEKIASVLDLAGSQAVLEAVVGRMKEAVTERRAGIELVALRALTATVDERALPGLHAKAGAGVRGRACPGCGLPIGAGWAKYCPECGATLTV